MKNRFLIPVLAFLALTSCRTALSVANAATEKNILLTTDLPEDPAFKKVIEPYKVELEGKMNTKISYTAVDLNKQGDNSNLGNLLADYTFEGADDWAKKNGIPGGVDAAVINVGGIRSTIGKGDILMKHIYEVMPFENEVMIVKMKGSDLKGLYDYYARTQKNNPVSRLYIETDNGMSVKELINGKEVEPAKNYYIATSDYLALGGDNMAYFGKGELISTGIKLRELFIEKFRANSEIVPPKDIRLLFKNKKNKTNE
ncbi:5'-nucleotidase C-terminal domain-containing protein [Chryseobacterium suipulveris]|uniref:5'-nucleotidase C-terminal domain-containing protein n=1 Tax=Chryseobacterium suipulveris TaxID=2929800 RepID=A0ABY4BMB8_9FLAO|nr:5'-nucleotidase [Chryseobacterium suipulveris]UOE40341.1 5'-nucleotidase C-terminal domain-containing protein [Chryseobacterium suipulveris]